MSHLVYCTSPKIAGGLTGMFNGGPFGSFNDDCLLYGDIPFVVSEQESPRLAIDDLVRYASLFDASFHKLLHDEWMSLTADRATFQARFPDTGSATLDGLKLVLDASPWQIDQHGDCVPKNTACSETPDSSPSP